MAPFTFSQTRSNLSPSEQVATHDLHMNTWQDMNVPGSSSLKRFFRPQNSISSPWSSRSPQASQQVSISGLARNVTTKSARASFLTPPHKHRSPFAESGNWWWHASQPPQSPDLIHSAIRSSANCVSMPALLESSGSSLTNDSKSYPHCMNSSQSLA